MCAPRQSTTIASTNTRNVRKSKSRTKPTPNFREDLRRVFGGALEGMGETPPVGEYETGAVGLLAG